MKHFKNSLAAWGQVCRPALGAAVLFSAAGVALAETAVAAKEGTQFDYGLSAGFSTMSLGNTHFGLGQLGANLSKDIARSEGYIAPRVNMVSETAGSGTLYGGLRAVSSFSRGDGDSWGLTIGEHWLWNGANPNAQTFNPAVVGKNMSYTNIDSAYLGWKSGSKFSSLDKDGLDVSVGPQNFQLGDGMVLADGSDEANQRKGIYWLDPRQAWKNTAIARISAAPYRAELFYLRSDKDSFNDAIVGGNFELVHAKLGKIGISHFEVNNSDMLARDGLKVTGLHGRGHPIASLPTLELAGEIDVQKNNSVDASAWFVEASYFMPTLPWYPTLGYRYASFSGDKAGTTGKSEGWDYLHNGSTPRGFGYWYQGIVVGTYETRLSNLDTHFLNLTLAPPIQGSWIKVLYYDHRFDQPSTAHLNGGAVSSDRFATEWNLMLGYSPSKKVDYIAIYGNAKPGQGGKERYSGVAGNANTGKNASMLQFTLLVHF